MRAQDKFLECDIGGLARMAVQIKPGFNRQRSFSETLRQMPVYLRQSARLQRPQRSFLLPLPPGEGWGEGGSQDNLITVPHAALRAILSRKEREQCIVLFRHMRQFFYFARMGAPYRFVFRG